MFNGFWYYTKREKTGIIVLIVISAVLLCSRFLVSSFSRNSLCINDSLARQISLVEEQGTFSPFLWTKDYMTDTMMISAHDADSLMILKNQKLAYLTRLFVLSNSFKDTTFSELVCKPMLRKRMSVLLKQFDDEFSEYSSSSSAFNYDIRNYDFLRLTMHLSDRQIMSLYKCPDELTAHALSVYFAEKYKNDPMWRNAYSEIRKYLIGKMNIPQ